MLMFYFKNKVLEGFVSKLTISQCREILRLSFNFDEEELKKNFHLLSKKYHPDKHLDKSDKEIENIKEHFYMIKEAYEYLSEYLKENKDINKPEHTENFQKYRTEFEYLYKKGLKFYKENDINNALECFTNAQRINKENTDCERAIIKCLIRKERRLHEAKERCIELTRKESFNPENFYILAKIYKQAGFSEVARELLEKCENLGLNKKLIEKELQDLGKEKNEKSFFSKLFKNRNYRKN